MTIKYACKVKTAFTYKFSNGATAAVPAWALLTVAAAIWAALGTYIWLWFNGYTGDE